MNRAPMHVVSRGYCPSDDAEPISFSAWAVRAIVVIIFFAFTQAVVTIYYAELIRAAMEFIK